MESKRLFSVFKNRQLFDGSRELYAPPLYAPIVPPHWRGGTKSHPPIAGGGVQNPIKKDLSSTLLGICTPPITFCFNIVPFITQSMHTRGLIILILMSLNHFKLAPLALAPPLAPTAGPKNKLLNNAHTTNFSVPGVLETSMERKLIQTPLAGPKD